MFIHIVKSGETLSGIAKNFGVPLQMFFADNGLSQSSQAVIGQALIIQEPDILHTVRSGETLFSIAQSYDTTVLQLLRNNYYLKGNTSLTAGQLLVIQYKNQNKAVSFVTNSYAYPFISRDLMREQMPFLTYITPFTYGIRADGGLVNLENDEWIIEMAGEYSSRPLMHLSTLTESGSFSSDRANMIFVNPDLQEKLITETINNMQAKGYDGLDIDFEFIYPEDRFNYVMFLQNVYSRINPLGYPLFSALAPKTSDTQPGLLYEGHDYGAIAASVDKVLLMTYEWGYTYSAPMAVAPIKNVENVVKYALTRISSSKILMGIPTYGYDWPLPFEKGITRAQSLSPVECIRLAERFGAIIEYDTTAQTPWFRYTDDTGQLHEVWFEDARSITAKLNLAASYNLSGLGYWNSMREFPQNWVVLNDGYNIINV